MRALVSLYQIPRKGVILLLGSITLILPTVLMKPSSYLKVTANISLIITVVFAGVFVQDIDSAVKVFVFACWKYKAISVVILHAVWGLAAQHLLRPKRTHARKMSMYKREAPKGVYLFLLQSPL